MFLSQDSDAAPGSSLVSPVDSSCVERFVRGRFGLIPEVLYRDSTAALICSPLCDKKDLQNNLQSTFSHLLCCPQLLVKCAMSECSQTYVPWKMGEYLEHLKTKHHFLCPDCQMRLPLRRARAAPQDRRGAAQAAHDAAAPALHDGAEDALGIRRPAQHDPGADQRAAHEASVSVVVAALSAANEAMRNYIQTPAFITSPNPPRVLANRHNDPPEDDDEDLYDDEDDDELGELRYIADPYQL